LTTRDTGMVALGYGKYVRGRDIVALIPIEDGERGEGRRTYVHVAGIPGPIVASRSERAILADMAHAPAVGQVPGTPAAAEEAPRTALAPRRWGRVRGAARR
jgi:hypothetical protein